MCSRLFNSIQDVSTHDIPFDGLSDQQIIHIMFENITDDSVNKKIKAEIRRWHPDKFKQKLGQKFVKEENDSIMKRVNLISQAINVFAMTNI